MELSLCALVPHPPILLPEVGGEQSQVVKKTFESMEGLGREIADIDPKVIIIISPHGAVFADALAVYGGNRISGDLKQFDAPDVRQEYSIDNDLVRAIVTECRDSGILAAIFDADLARVNNRKVVLDHGMMIPLYFTWREGVRAPIVVMGMSFMPFLDLYKAGMAITRAIRGYGRRDQKAVIIASGDLSHRLLPEAPAGFDQRAAEFDKWLMESLGRYDVQGIMEPDRVLLEKAGECGFRSIIMMLGALDGFKVKSSVKSYEGPFGVGYGVVSFKPAGEASSLYDVLMDKHLAKVDALRKNESAPVRLARRVVESWVKGAGKIAAEELDNLPARAGTFVSIKKHGELRGCIGTTGPTEPSVAQEIISNAIKAATEDPRFAPISEEELIDLVYSVDILSEPEPITDISELDPKKYGVIIRKGHRTGLLLPNLEGIETVEEQVAIASRKAGLKPDEKVSLERFEVIRYR